MDSKDGYGYPFGVIKESLQQRDTTLSKAEIQQPNTGRAEILSLERHKHIKFHVATDFTFAAPWLYVPVHNRELNILSRHLPILFTRNAQGDLSPCALLKIPGKSAINPVGKWMPGKLPDLIRLYPFGWIQDGNRSSLTLYPEAPHFDGPGEKLITSRGKPTQKLNKIIDALAPVREAFADTRLLMEELKALNVLTPVTLSIGRSSGTHATTLWLATGPEILKRQMSPRLRALLSMHLNSSRIVFTQIQGNQSQSADTATAEVNDQTHESHVSDEKTPDVHSLLQQVCRQFGVTVDDLRSRKRNEALKKARTALVYDANSSGCLHELAIQLERRVETIKKWM